MDDLCVSFFPGVVSKTPQQQLALDWPELSLRLSRHEARAEKGGPMWAPISLVPGKTLAAKHVARVSCFVMDYDFGVPPAAVAPQWEALTYLLHTTWSHTTVCPKWRVVFPFLHPVAGPDYAAVWTKLVYHLSGGFSLDVKCKDPSRKWFLPSSPAASLPHAYALVHTGARLDPETLEEPPPTVRTPATAARFAPETNSHQYPADRLLDQALTRAREWGRNNGAFHLGQQMRWNGYTLSETEQAIYAYVTRCPTTNLKGEPEAFDAPEALRAGTNGWNCNPRAPWGAAESGKKGGAATATRSRRRAAREPAGAPDDDGEGDTAGPHEGPSESRQNASEEAAEQAQTSKQAPLSEKELGHRFAEQMRGTLMTTDGGVWWRYREGVWSHQDRHAVLATVESYVEPHYVRGQYARLVEAVARVAAYRLYVPLARLNAHPEWIALQNGVFDTGSGRLLPHAATNLLTVQLPYPYDPAATCPKWLQFLAEMLVDETGAPSSELVALLQEWFGYCLIPDSRAQASMWWLGGGANGKGVATKMLEALVGRENVVGVDIEQLHEPYQRASLYGKLVGVVGEIPLRAMTKNGQRFKEIVSGDTISARQPGKDFFTFTPTVRILCTANELPHTADRTFGYFRRLILVGWRRNLTEEEQNRNLTGELLAELPGICNWALAGLARLREQGFHFSRAQLAEQEVESYRMEEDAPARFLDDWCDREAGGMELFADLWSAFQRWCKVNGEDAGRSNAFSRSLTRLGYPPRSKWNTEHSRPDKAREGLVLAVRSWEEIAGDRYSW